MQVYGNIATELTERKDKNGKPFFTFRLAENIGKDENRTTTWYDVVFFKAEEADLLSRGDFVKVTGAVEASAFNRRDGSLGASLRLRAFSIELVDSKFGRSSKSEEAAA